MLDNKTSRPHSGWEQIFLAGMSLLSSDVETPASLGGRLSVSLSQFVMHALKFISSCVNIDSLETSLNVHYHILMIRAMGGQSRHSVNPVEHMKINLGSL